MTQKNAGSPGGALSRAAGTALEQLAVAVPGMVLVTGRRPGPGAGFAREAPERWRVVPGRLARLAVGVGVSAGGRPAVVCYPGAADARTAPWELAGTVVAVTGSTEVAAAAWEAGVRVAVPAWPSDVAPLLHDALVRGPVCLYLHTEPVALGAPLALVQPSLLAPRTVTHGTAGRFAAAGALVAPLLEVAWRLARRGQQITLQQLTCLEPADPGPRAAASNVFWDAGDHWKALPVESADPSDIERTVEPYLVG